MLHKIRGIVLKTTPYSESSVVVQIFTDKFGLQSYLINGVKKPRAKITMNMLQPLHLLDMVAYFKQSTAIQRLAEARPAPSFTTIPYNILKNTMTMFLNEVLYKSIRQQGADEQLFDFLHHAVCWLDETPNIHPNFHLAFLLKITKYLGFAPSIGRRGDQLYFDLQEGEFTALMPPHLNFLHDQDASAFLALYSVGFERLDTVSLSTRTRRALLEKILLYYRLHTASFGEIQSHHILEEVLG
ncbi:MAG: DNA repair protein RecO [Sphingobacteriaceae bacterium]|nr:MAG: DNA repair protein RecO [Sphingobacteriaceae bacterium]